MAVRRMPRTLVLNADFSPLSITRAARGLSLLRQNKAVVVEAGSTVLRSEKLALEPPSVIVLTQYRTMQEHKSLRSGTDTVTNRWLILERDSHTCQYCGAKDASTIDHVKPVSKGGPSTWGNLVAAWCAKTCVARMGARLGCCPLPPVASRRGPCACLSRHPIHPCTQSELQRREERQAAGRVLPHAHPRAAAAATGAHVPWVEEARRSR